MILRDKFGKASESFQVCLMPVSILYIVLTPVGFTSRFGNIRTISVIINNWWTRGSIDKRTMTNTNLITLYFQSGCHVMLHMSLIYVYIYTYFQHLSFPPLCNPWDPRLGLSHGFSFRGKKKPQELCPFSEDLHENWGPPPGELNTDGQDLLVYGASDSCWYCWSCSDVLFFFVDRCS